MDTILLIPVLVPLAVGFVLLFAPNRLNPLTRVLTVMLSVLMFPVAVRIFTLDEARLAWSILQIYDFNLDLLLATTPLGAFILIFVTGFGALISLYSLRSTAHAKRPNEYYGSILLTIGGSAGIVLCDHLLFLVIFWEIVTASLYVLITTGGRNARIAATKSFAMIGASDAALLLGVALLWALSGTFVLSELSQNSLAVTSALPIVAFLLLVLAALTKAGALPLHTWLPTSGEFAPASVMALLPAAIDKLLGIYLLILIVTRMFALRPGVLSTLLAAVGAATIVIAVMIAMVQHNLKKLLSYHAISQVGYMVLGIATMTPVGIAGGVFHMLNHSIYKCCLFLCGGAVEQQAGTPELDRLGGLGRLMPLTFAACLIAALSISGIPPLNGFASKWMVYQGVIEMGATDGGPGAALWPIWLVAAMFGSALTLASFVKLLHSMFMSRLPDELRYVREAPAWQTGPMIVLASLCVVFGVFYHVPLRIFIYPALGIERGTAIWGMWNSILGTGAILLGIAIGMGMLAVGGLAKKIRMVPTWTCGERQPNSQMSIPGTHFYKTVSSLRGLSQLYRRQEDGHFDPYNHGGRAGLGLTAFLRWLHGGLLPVYLTWVVVGLLIILFVVCAIW